MAYVVGEVVAPISGDPSGFHNAINGVKQAGDDLAKGMSARMQDIGAGMSKLGGRMTMKVTGPIVGAGTAVFKLGKDFEYELSKVVGLVGVAQEQVDEWGKDILQMAPKLGKAPKELADALFFVTSAGLRGAEAMEVLEMSAQASASGLGETKVIADLVTSAMNAYGTENLSAGKATDILVAAVREGKAEASELAATMGSVLPIAAEMGVTFDQVGAAQAAMTRTGTDASTAATQLKNIMVGLMKPSKQAEEALNAMGTSSSELRSKLRDEGLPAALMNIRELTHDYGEEMMATVFPNVRALMGVLDLMGSNMEENMGIFERMTDTTGSLGDAMGAASETAEFKMQQTLAQLKSTAIEFFGTLKEAAIPVMEQLTVLLARVAEWFGNLSPEMQQTVLRAVALVAALGPLLLITGKIIGAIGALGGAVKGIGGAFKGMGTIAAGVTKLFGAKSAAVAGTAVAAKAATGGTAALAGGLGAVAGPALLAVGAIAGVGYGAYKLHQHMKKDAIPAVQEFGEEVSETTKTAVNGFLDLYNEADDSLKLLAWSGSSVTEEMAHSISANFAEMSSQIVTGLEESRQQGVAALNKMFTEASSISEEEQAAMLESLNQGYADRQSRIEEQEARIAEILQTASDERRELSRAEMNEITSIQDQMKNEAVRALSETELEQKAILENMKLNSETLSAQQAAEVVKNSMDQKERAIAEAEEQYKESVKQFIYMRDELGSITKEQADSLIAEAQRQRDGVLDNADDMHKQVIDKAQEQAGEHVGLVDWETGEVLSKWQALWKSLVGGSIVPDMVEGILGWLGKMSRDGVSLSEEAKQGILGAFSDLPGRMLDVGKNALSSLASGIRNAASSAVSAARSVASNVVSSAKNLFGIRSPSKVFADMGVNLGAGLKQGILASVGMVQDAAKRMGHVAIEGPELSVGDAVQSAAQKIGDIAVQGPDVAAVAGNQTITHNHNFEKLTIEGVNNEGEFMGSVDVLIDKIASAIGSDDRRVPNRTALMPGM